MYPGSGIVCLTMCCVLSFHRSQLRNPGMDRLHQRRYPGTGKTLCEATGMFTLASLVPFFFTYCTSIDRSSSVILGLWPKGSLNIFFKYISRIQLTVDMIEEDYLRHSSCRCTVCLFESTQYLQFSACA